jgi:hypothetical protein
VIGVASTFGRTTGVSYLCAIVVPNFALLQPSVDFYLKVT